MKASGNRFIVRKVIQFISMLSFFFLLYRTHIFPLPEKVPLSIYFKINGLLTLLLTISTGKFLMFFLPGLIMILLIMVIGNFFCYWICPLGGSIDFLNLLKLKKIIRPSFILPPKMKNAGLWILIFSLFLAISAKLFSTPIMAGFIFDPFVILGQAMTGVKFWIIFLLIIVIGSILYPRLWCNCFCPLGRFYTIIGKISKIFRKTKTFQ